MCRVWPEGWRTVRRMGLASAWLASFAVAGAAGCASPSGERSVVGCSEGEASACECAAGMGSAGCSDEAAVMVGSDSRTGAIEASTDGRAQTNDAGEALDSEALDNVEGGSNVEAPSLADSEAATSNPADAEASVDATAPGVDTADSAVDVSDAAPVPVVGMAQPCAAISATGSVLLDLGHAVSIVLLWQSGDRILSEDSDGHWILWDVTHRSQVASGDVTSSSSGISLALPEDASGNGGTQALGVDLVGTTVAVPTPTSITLLSAVDGHTLHTIALASGLIANYGLASDGSYVWVASPSSLEAWSTAGKVLANRQGNYFGSQIFAAPTELRVAESPVADLEIVSTVNGSSKVALRTNSLPSSFESWFVDGNHFLTLLVQDGATGVTSTITVYSAAGVKQSEATLPFDTGFVVGQGAYYWTTEGNSNAPPEVFGVGGGTAPVWTPPQETNTAVGVAVGVGNQLAFSEDNNALHILDLSGAKVVETVVNFPVEGPGFFAADFAGNWSVSSGSGGSLVYDGATAIGPNGPQSLDCGRVTSVAGAPTGKVGISVEAGQVLYVDLNASPRALVASLAFVAGKVALSNDGSLLGALGPTLRVFDMPSGASQDIFALQNGAVDFSLSGVGTTVGLTTQRFEATVNKNIYTRRLADVATGATFLTDAFQLSPNFRGSPPIALSPDGTLAAMCDFASESPTASATTNIFSGGRIVGTAQGYPVGWLDNERLVVNAFEGLDGSPNVALYAGTFICDAQGAVIASLPVPGEIDGFTVLGGGTQIYDAETNTIYNVSSGSVAWTSSDSPQSLGDVAGNFVVMANDHQVLVETH